MLLLRRMLPSGRIISVDTCDGEMLKGGMGIAHLNMDNSDNRAANLQWCNEADAREKLLTYEE